LGKRIKTKGYNIIILDTLGAIKAFSTASKDICDDKIIIALDIAFKKTIVTAPLSVLYGIIYDAMTTGRGVWKTIFCTCRH